MGQIFVPTVPSIILTDVDRLVARNSDGGISPLASHIILFGQAAGQNMGDLDNVIAMGAFAFDGGVTDPNLAGSIVIGVNAYSGALNTAASGIATASVIIGTNAMGNAAAGAGANVVIGTDALADGLGGGGSNYSSNVFIGVRAGQGISFANGAPLSNNVVIGFNAAQGSGIATSLIGSVIIGQGACSGFSNGANDNVVIGTDAGPLMSGNQNVVIGRSATSATATGANNVAVGSGASYTSGSFNTNVGSGTGCSTGSTNVLLGSRIGAITSTSNNVIIGNQAGVFTGLTNLANQFLLDSTGQSLLYGRFDRGNLMVGGAAAANRTQLATVNPQNALFVTNGARGAGAPSGGGFFFVVGGEASYVSSAGTDYVISPHSSRGVFTVATLPAAGLIAGQKGYVSDAAAPAFGAAVVGGGAVFIPVFWNGAAWIVG